MTSLPLLKSGLGPFSLQQLNIADTIKKMRKLDGVGKISLRDLQPYKELTLTYLELQVLIVSICPKTHFLYLRNFPHFSYSFKKR